MGANLTYFGFMKIANKSATALIDQRLAELAREDAADIAEFQERRQKREAEQKELMGARVTIERLSVAGGKMTSSFSIKAAKEAKADGVSIPKEGTKRPDGIPTIADMIDSVLADAERIGKDGLRGRDLIIGISDRWWPGVGWNSILPSAIRLVHKGRLGKRNGLYCRVDARGHPVADQRPVAH